MKKTKTKRKPIYEMILPLRHEENLDKIFKKLEKKLKGYNIIVYTSNESLDIRTNFYYAD